MENDNMDFSSYDQYLKKFDEVIGSPEGIDEPETERMMEIPDVSSPEPLAQPAETQPAGETKESADDRYKVVPPDGIDFMSEKSPAPIASIILKSLGADCDAPKVSSPINANPSIADLSNGGES